MIQKERYKPVGQVRGRRNLMLFEIEENWTLRSEQPVTPMAERTLWHAVRQKRIKYAGGVR